jgi:hypothetical protein
MADYDAAPKLYNQTLQFLLTRAATLARILQEKLPSAPSETVRAQTLHLCKDEYADLMRAMSLFDGLWEHHCAANGLPTDHTATYWD